MAAVIDSSQKSECRIHTNGTKRWFLNGKLHREDRSETGVSLPAVEYPDGSKWWCLNDKRHRKDINPETGLTMPAIEYADGSKCWYLNGKCHREDGPAIEFADGETRYWINGNYIPQLDNKRIYGKDNLTKYLILL